MDSFRTTDGKPFVGKLSLIKDSTTFTTADLSAFLINEGDAPVSAYGFCWSVEEEPTIEADTITCTNLADNGKLQEGSGLGIGQKILCKGYAINDFGTVYSEEEITISTKSEKPNIITFPITLDSIKVMEQFTLAGSCRMAETVLLQSGEFVGLQAIRSRVSRIIMLL